MLRRCQVRYAVGFKDFPNARVVTLNREKALNALNTAMVDEMATIYQRTPHANPKAVIVLKGSGKAFCAGGDVVSIVKDTPPGTKAEFFYKEYQVNHHIMTMPQAQVALWDGVVMGGGVGISIHGRYRVATEKAVFAMPETSIGLFPDVGGSWFLPRLPSKSVGLYLSLTGQRLKGADLKHAGLATHYVPSEAMGRLEEALCNVKDVNEVEGILNSFDVKELPPYSLANDSGWMIEKVFDRKKPVEELIHALKSEGTELGTNMAEGLLKCSPTALKVSRELFSRGAELTDPKEVFKMEYYCTQRAMALGDFTAGVTALLIDKTGKPAWSPATLADVTDDLVASHFKPHAPTTREWSPTVPFAEAKPPAPVTADKTPVAAAAGKVADAVKQ